MATHIELMGYPANLYLMQVRSLFLDGCQTQGGLHASRSSGLSWSSHVQVEQLDLVQLHWWDYSVEGMVETAQALDTLRKKGLIRSIGLTNIGCGGLQQILDAGVPIVSNQVHAGRMALAVHAQLQCSSNSKSPCCQAVLALHECCRCAARVQGTLSSSQCMGLYAGAILTVGQAAPAWHAAPV